MTTYATRQVPYSGSTACYDSGRGGQYVHCEPSPSKPLKLPFLRGRRLFLPATVFWAFMWGYATYVPWREYTETAGRHGGTFVFPLVICSWAIWVSIEVLLFPTPFPFGVRATMMLRFVTWLGASVLIYLILFGLLSYGVLAHPYWEAI